MYANFAYADEVRNRALQIHHGRPDETCWKWRENWFAVLEAGQLVHMTLTGMY
jgi:hypothetical protein